MNTYLHKQICLLIYNVNFLLMHIQNRQTTQSKKGCVFSKKFFTFDQIGRQNDSPSASFYFVSCVKLTNNVVVFKFPFRFDEFLSWDSKIKTREILLGTNIWKTSHLFPANV